MSEKCRNLSAHSNIAEYKSAQCTSIDRCTISRKPATMMIACFSISRAQCECNLNSNLRQCEKPKRVQNTNQHVPHAQPADLNVKFLSINCNKYKCPVLRFESRRGRTTVIPQRATECRAMRHFSREYTAFPDLHNGAERTFSPLASMSINIGAEINWILFLIIIAVRRAEYAEQNLNRDCEKTTRISCLYS